MFKAINEHAHFLINYYSIVEIRKDIPKNSLSLLFLIINKNQSFNLNTENNIKIDALSLFLFERAFTMNTLYTLRYKYIHGGIDQMLPLMLSFDYMKWNNEIIQELNGLNKKISYIEIRLTSSDNLYTIENEKKRKYYLLANELKFIYKCKNKIIPIDLTWDELKTIYHKQYLKIKVDRSVICDIVLMERTVNG
ncbi:hypothetical protein NAPIS_ORF01489 [Vairimorpha apis BRL 01]|uniref:Uncharacterized protein n=1 Tax=Vairimorpha apis BRL 01 TaxID=1037528 RepID=T0L8Y0_9MICR|nr:hypothetical protein NAPIS_ORF01489 [Vairimorpha apis BRL 01]